MKYGGSDVGFLLVDGYDLLGSEVLDVTVPEPEAVTEESHGLGKAWVEYLATGVRKAVASLQALYDDATDAIADTLDGQEATERVVCWGITGNAVGAKFIGAQGAFGAKYKRMFTRGALHRVNLDQTITGAVDEGIVLQHLAAKTIDWDTEGAESQDFGASSSAGGAAYQQITAISGFSGFVGTIRHSADDSTYADLVAFDDATAVGAQRKTVAGTVNRHTAYQGDVTGSGSITVMGGFCRA